MKVKVVSILPWRQYSAALLCQNATRCTYTMLLKYKTHFLSLEPVLEPVEWSSTVKVRIASILSMMHTGGSTLLHCFVKTHRFAVTAGLNARLK